MFRGRSGVGKSIISSFPNSVSLLDIHSISLAGLKIDACLNQFNRYVLKQSRRATKSIASNYMSSLNSWQTWSLYKHI